MSRSFPRANSNYLNAGDVSAVDVVGTALTVSTWVKITTPDNGISQGIISKSTSVAQEGQYQLVFSGATQAFKWQIGDAVNTDSADGATTPISNKWYNLIGVKTSALLTLYLGGVVEASVASTRTIQNTANNLFLGNRPDNNAPFGGSIAEVGIWNVVLTLGEILALSKGISPISVRNSNLQAYWPLWGTVLPEPSFRSVKAPAALTGSVPISNHCLIGPNVAMY